MNETVRQELLELRADDLRVRAELERAGRLLRGYDQEMETVHRRNSARLRGIVAEHGWPTPLTVGTDGAEAVWLIVQHAIGEPDFQRRALPLFEQAALRGEIPGWQPAYLMDRIRMLEGWPQLYGTQMAPDADGRIVVWPIADTATLNERRRTVGLRPFEERRTEPAPDGPSPDEGRTRRAEMDAWARRAGWRRRILHLATETAWAKGIATNAYTADSLSTEGFIHCSEPQQVVWVANNRFSGRHDLLLLQIDIRKLTVEGRYENLQGGQELFPHIYGALNLDAVIGVTPFLPGADGAFDHNQLAAVY
jgi:uncharacterized protein (DUF952 family)